MFRTIKNYVHKQSISGKLPDEHQSTDSSLTLEQLLESSQPYTQLKRLDDPAITNSSIDDNRLSRMRGSLIDLAVGDALGAPVEFRPRLYLQYNPVTKMQQGGTWGLAAGQWTDDTSMALCTAASLIVKRTFDPYDQIVRYKRWYRNGYMSSTGTCFDIGKSTREAIKQFEATQKQCAKRLGKEFKLKTDKKSIDTTIQAYCSRVPCETNCGADDACGNGSLMRLAPIPIFYHESIDDAIDSAAKNAALTHGDKRAIDVNRYYCALIWNALRGVEKNKLLSPQLYHEYFREEFDPELMRIINGSYKKKNGYDDGIRGNGFVLNSLEAALWAFHRYNSFKEGMIEVINLGDDTDTTAAIYGELAGAYYGVEAIPNEWVKELFQKEFIDTLVEALFLRGEDYHKTKEISRISSLSESDKTHEASSAIYKPESIFERN